MLGVPDAHDIARLAKGVTIDGRRTATGATSSSCPDGTNDSDAAHHDREGRNRQVRKMFDAIGHPVDHLRRVAIGPLRDTRLKPGHWRDLTDAEVQALRKAASRTPPAQESGRPTPRARRGGPAHG